VLNSGTALQHVVLDRLVSLLRGLTKCVVTTLITVIRVIPAIPLPIPPHSNTIRNCDDARECGRSFLG